MLRSRQFLFYETFAAHRGYCSGSNHHADNPKDPMKRQAGPFHVRSVEHTLKKKEPFTSLLFYRPKTEDLAEEFRMAKDVSFKRKTDTRSQVRHRTENMRFDQNWTAVWPTAASFKQSSVPMPIRQGSVPRFSQTCPPDKYVNIELIKIPNFLHLTPKHIEEHCEVLKKFCTPFPYQLKNDFDCEKHFPLKITSCNFVHSGPSMRDERSRVASLSVRVKKLPRMDLHSRDKLLRLLTGAAKYDKATDILTITADRCPTRKQNQDYCLYLLTALYHESQKKNNWEGELKSVDDDENYFFDRWTVSQRAKVVADKVHKEGAENIVNNLRETWERVRNADEEKIEDFVEMNNDIAKVYGLGPFPS